MLRDEAYVFAVIYMDGFFFFGKRRKWNEFLLRDDYTLLVRTYVYVLIPIFVFYEMKGMKWIFAEIWRVHSFLLVHMYMDGSKFLFCSSECNEMDFCLEMIRMYVFAGTYMDRSLYIYFFKWMKWNRFCWEMTHTRLLVYMDGSNFLFFGREGNGFCWREIWNPIFLCTVPYVKISKFIEKNLGNVFHSLLQFFKSTQFLYFRFTYV